MFSILHQLFDLEMVDKEPLHEIWYYKFLFIDLLISCPQNWPFLLNCITYNISVQVWHLVYLNGSLLHISCSVQYNIYEKICF